MFLSETSLALDQSVLQAWRGACQCSDILRVSYIITSFKSFLFLVQFPHFKVSVSVYLVVTSLGLRPLWLFDIKKSKIGVGGNQVFICEPVSWSNQHRVKDRRRELQVPMDPSLMMDIKTNITLGLLIIENGTHKGYQHVVVPQTEDLKDEDGKTPLLSWWQLTGPLHWTLRSKMKEFQKKLEDTRNAATENQLTDILTDVLPTFLI